MEPLSQMKREHITIMDDADSANRKNFVPSQSFTLGSLSTSVFETRTATGREHFAC